MSKNSIFIKIVIASILLIGLVGCGGKKAEPKVDANSKGYTDPMFDGAPQWVIAPYLEGTVVALGVASPNAGNDYSFQVEEAVADGRTKLARRIETKIKSMFKQFKATTGAGKSGTYDKATSSVSKQVSNQTLRGTKMMNSWINKQRTLFVLVGIDSKEVAQMTEAQTKTSFKNDKALYQEFKAKKAFDELDLELQKP
jgi:uncharacterized lipoprotein YehR (DUF1307 family)